MVIRTLEELMASDVIKGFQSESEVAIARNLISKVGTEKATQLWNDGISNMDDIALSMWNRESEDEVLHIMVSDLTKPVEELNLDRIVPASFPTLRHTQPLIIFMVS